MGEVVLREVKCSTDGCDRERECKGLCGNCYRKQWRAEKLLADPSFAEKLRSYGRKCDRARQTDPVKADKRRQWRREWLADNDQLRARRYAYDNAAKRKKYAEQQEYRDAISARMRHRRSKVSVSLANSLRLLQQGHCAICSAVMLLGKRGMSAESADHCHTTGEPRGLLCAACNTGLGKYERHQRPNGLRVEAYEAYLANPPVRQLASPQLSFTF